MLQFLRISCALLVAFSLLSACGARRGGSNADNSSAPTNSLDSNDDLRQRSDSTIWDLFRRGRGNETSVQVNRYLWAASLEVLDFLPVQTIDPYTGVIVTGYGRPPGGGRAYRATVLIDDPALDARSLNVALQSKGGAVSASTVRAIEDAILTRARQMRVADKKI